MKKTSVLIITLICLATISCTQKTDVAAEKDAVLKALQEEGDAFAANDMNRLAAIHIQDSTDTRIGSGCTYFNTWQGWNEIKKLYEDYIKRNSGDTTWQNPQNIKENVIMKVTGNSAWVLCDNIWEYTFNGESFRQANKQLAIFEKVNGEWKFAFDSFMEKPAENEETSE
jgi:hypothetical protein